MRLASVLASAAALSMATAPLAAQAAPLEARAGSTVEGENIAGLGSLWLVALAVALAVGIYLIVDDGNEDLPSSP